MESLRDLVRIQIVSSAENTPLIEHDLHELLSDAAACEYSSYVDDNGMTFIKRVHGERRGKRACMGLNMIQT